MHMRKLRKKTLNHIKKILNQEPMQHIHFLLQQTDEIICLTSSFTSGIIVSGCLLSLRINYVIA